MSDQQKAKKKYTSAAAFAFGICSLIFLIDVMVGIKNIKFILYAAAAVVPFGTVMFLPDEEEGETPLSIGERYADTIHKQLDCIPLGTPANELKGAYDSSRELLTIAYAIDSEVNEQQRQIVQVPDYAIQPNLLTSANSNIQNSGSGDAAGTASPEEKEKERPSSQGNVIDFMRRSAAGRSNDGQQHEVFIPPPLM